MVKYVTYQEIPKAKKGTISVPLNARQARRRAQARKEIKAKK